MVATASKNPSAQVSGWVGAAIALGIAAVALVWIWGMALPVTPPGTVCAAIHPPTAGCAGDARLAPAAVWTVLLAGAVAAAFFLGRRGWWGVLVGAVIAGGVGVAGYFATWSMNVFLVV
ncbi:hypothetical protein [Agromyces larvae]|uniref:Uncharacterized protein n=1 Tax=Agromyces larvae TaxID=2929802 RepID=A0ABY4BXU1_9MICO|nr:hypothetical protein [Agromyces larvae]UOE44046.1 hypothetical protein MTO99_18115 [Agromyces larvae]